LTTRRKKNFGIGRRDNLDDAFAAIEDVAIAMRENKIENAFMGGVDVGRTRNLTELFY
jgi:hypothetical protein